MKALIVRGGWDGHRPVESTELFVPFLQNSGYEVRIEESPEERRVGKSVDQV